MNNLFKLIIIATTAISVSAFAGGKLQDTQTLRVSADSMDMLDIDVGAGKLNVIGDDSLDEVIVVAEIYQDRADDNYRISLESERGSRIELYTDVDNGGLFGWTNDTSIDLTVRVPTSMNIQIDDGSGQIEVTDIDGELSIDDGSGSISIENISGDVEIDDGSGSIVAVNLGGDLKVDDGSGSINAEDIAGTVTVWDGSGSINVDGAGDFVLKNDGSGGLDINNVASGSDY